MTTMDRQTLKHLEKLEAMKADAIQQEDYLLAKELKERITRLKNLSEQIALLESRKKKAILKEDFESASALKDEINRIRRQFEAPMGTPNMANQKVGGPNIGSQRAYGNENRYRDSQRGYEGGMAGQERYGGGMPRPSNTELRTDRESRQFTRDSIPSNVVSEHQYTPKVPEYVLFFILEIILRLYKIFLQLI